jgi:phosphoglycerate dehydrogenase-like enzyme
VAERARAFGLRVIAVRRTPGVHPLLEWCGPMSELPRLLIESDFVAVVCPLTDETKGLLGEIELRLMRPHALLINTARAAIIHEHALYRALSERWIAGAALDVWYHYPADPEAGQHGSQYPFHTLSNVIVTPHYSGWTEAMIQRRYRRIAENLDHLARGEPLERVVYMAPGDGRE